MVSLIKAEIYSVQKTSQSVTGGDQITDYFNNTDLPFTQQNVSSAELDGFAYVSDMVMDIQFNPNIVISVASSVGGNRRGRLEFTANATYDNILPVANQNFTVFDRNTDSSTTITLDSFTFTNIVDNYADQPLTANLSVESESESGKYTFDNDFTFDLDISVFIVGRQP